jgi:stalled ribosome rescue protein Dom34
MTMHRNAAVWLDHREARVFHVDSEGADRSRLRAAHEHVHRHPADGGERAHPHENDAFFHHVAGALSDAEQILVVGPSTAKLQFVRYLRAQAPKIEAKIVGLESVDHPTDAQLIDYARRYFEVPPPRVHLKE